MLHVRPQGDFLFEAGRGGVGYRDPCSRRLATCSGRQAARIAASARADLRLETEDHLRIHNSPLFAVWGHGEPRFFRDPCRPTARMSYPTAKVDTEPMKEVFDVRQTRRRAETN